MTVSRLTLADLDTGTGLSGGALAELLTDMKAAGQIVDGRPSKKTLTQKGGFSRLTLERGVDASVSC